MRQLGIALFLLAARQLSAQQGSDLAGILQHEECATDHGSQVQVCHADYEVDGRTVEALLFRPMHEGRFAAALLIPGHDRTALDLVRLGVALASKGIAGLAVSQPGYGKSKGPSDYVGPKTIRVLTEGYRRLQQQPFVDPARMGIYGYSRGGMAASLLAVHLDDVKAAVLGAGIYDFRRAHDETALPGIRRNMEVETGFSPEAIRERSSILMMDKLRCPVLILHGGRDQNVPVSQALLLRDRLTSLGKEFEIRIFPEREHAIGPAVSDLTIDFFLRKLK